MVSTTALERGYLTFAELRELTTPQLNALKRDHHDVFEKSLRMVPQTANQSDYRKAGSMPLTTSERSELERLRKSERERRAEDLVRAAAGDTFVDTDLAIAVLQHNGDLDLIADAREAKAAVREIASDKPNLVKGGGSASLPAAGGKVGINSSGAISQEQLLEMSAADLAALQIRDPGLYERSINALV